MSNTQTLTNKKRPLHVVTSYENEWFIISRTKPPLVHVKYNSKKRSGELLNVCLVQFPVSQEKIEPVVKKAIAWAKSNIATF